MEKLEKMINDINIKFDTHINIFKAGGRFMVIPEEEHTINGKKMVEIREYIDMHTEELDDDDV